MVKPKVSFVLATYQGEKTIKKCLDSVFSQNYSKKLFEVLVLDGGSKDNTVGIAKKYPIRFFKNPKKYSEGEGMGKAQGFNKARGEIVIFIDQDNVLLSKNWLKNILEPLEDNEEISISGSHISIVKNDNLLNKYLSLVGTDPFAAAFSIDGQVNLDRRQFDKIKNYLVFQMNKNRWYIAGSNGYAYRKKDIKNIGGYSQDTDIIYKFASLNKKLAINLDAPLQHLNITTGKLSEFIKKRISHFTYFVEKNSKGRKVKFVPSELRGKLFVLVNYLSILMIVPNLLISLKNFLRDKQPLWLLHPFMAFLTLLIYTKVILFSKEGKIYLRNNFLHKN